MVDKTLEAFGLSVEEMKEANQKAAEQMLPVPYDIPGEVGPSREDRFGDTAAWAAKDSWEEAKSRFQARGTQEGVAGAIPDADSSVLNTFAAGLGYAADMGLSGLAASDAAWRYSVGLASELIPGMDKSQEQRFTRDVSSIPEAFAGNVTGVVGGIDRLPDVRQATTGARMAAEDVLDAMPEYDPNRVNIFGGLGARNPGYDRTGRPLPESVGSEGMYRFEIDDSGSVAIPGNLKTFSGLNSEIPNLPEVADVFIHDELFDQYPSVRNIRIGLDDSLGSTTRGYFDSDRNLIAVNKNIGTDPKKLRSTLTHELQHFIQKREGFASGSNLDNARKTPQAIEMQRQQREIADTYNRAVIERFEPEKVINRLGEISQGLLDAVEYYGGDVARAIENPMSLKFNYDIPFIISYSFRRFNEVIDKAQDNLVPGFSEGAIQKRLLGSIDTDLNSLGRDLARTIPEEVPLGPLKDFADDFRSLYARFGSKNERDLSTDQMMELREGASRIVSKFLGLPEKPKSFFDPAFEAYRRAGGEVESRNTQNRIDFDEARRFRETPESTEDVPRELQYNPNNSGGSSSSSAMPTEGIRVFHASPQEIEGEFRLSNTDVGLHFANNPNLAENAAVKSAFERPSAAENIRSQEFVINAKPEQIVDIPASANRFDFYDVLDSLYENGRIDQGLFNEIFDGLESIEDLSTTGASMLQEQNKFFADSLSRNTDIRALRYMNEFDAGPTWRDFEQGQTTSSVTPDYSYIVLDPKFVTRPTNPREFNEGGLAMERQMNTMMAEGGIKDSGMNRDPISGNEIPAGSLAKEVRDDVDAKLSEGEYVVPADVVRFFGVNYFEKLRQKAKAGLEEMDRDGRIGGDPVGAPMGDMDEALSDEEMFALNEMFKGGMVSGYAPGGDVTSNQSQLPANEFQLPQSVFATSPPPPAATTPTTLYGPSGDVIVLMLPTEQERYNQLISEGYSTKPIEAPTASGEDTGRDRDRDRSAISTPQVGTGEGGFNFSLSEDESRALSDDPLAFGKGALDGDRLLSSRTLAGVGALGGLPGMLIGGGVGAVLELQDVAKARAGLIKARAQNLDGTPEFLALEKALKEKENNMNFATKALDKTGLFTGQGYVDSLQTSAATVGAATPEAIPTGSPSVSDSDKSGFGSNQGSQMGAKMAGAGAQTVASSSSPPVTTTTAKKSTPSGASTGAKAKIDAGSTGYSPAPKKETIEQKVGRGGGFASGGLVQRPKKKPVAKK